MNAATSNIEDHLLGAWTLVEWSEQRPGGQKAFPLGEDAIGQIIYTADGYVAAQLSRRGRYSFPSGDWRKASEEDAARAFKEYFGYFGTFSIDTKRQVVTHDIEGSWFPNLEGGDQERHYRFEDGLLVLDADTDWGQVRIVWRKAGASAVVRDNSALRDRPRLRVVSTDAEAAVEAFAAGLQAGHDQRDAGLLNRQFAADVSGAVLTALL